MRPSVTPLHRQIGRSAALAVGLSLAGCATAPPSTVHGAPATSAAPGKPWTPPAGAAAPLTTRETRPGTAPARTVPAEVASRMQAPP